MSLDAPRPSFTVGTWNVESGGFRVQGRRDTHDVTIADLPSEPQYEKEIIEGIITINSDFVALIDTYGWGRQIEREVLKNTSKLNIHTNPLNELSNNSIGGTIIGTNITVLSDFPDPKWESIRLANRNCLKSSVNIGGYPVDIYAVYLHHLREKYRLQETAVLVHEIKKSKNRVIILGDFNSTPVNSANIFAKVELYLFDTLPRKYLSLRLKNPLIKKMKSFDAFTTGVSRKILKSLRELNEKYKNHGAIKLIKSELGFTSASDIDNENTFPTPGLYHFPFRIINVDHIFVSPGLKINYAKVLHDKPFEASDHYPRIAKIEIVNA